MSIETEFARLIRGFALNGKGFWILLTMCLKGLRATSFIYGSYLKTTGIFLLSFGRGKIP